jgi:hypothetical protein
MGERHDVTVKRAIGYLRKWLSQEPVNEDSETHLRWVIEDYGTPLRCPSRYEPPHFFIMTFTPAER